MTHIKDQDLCKKRDLNTEIVVHIIEQANFTIRNLSKRATVAMLIECENCLSDFLPILKLIAKQQSVFTHVLHQMNCALEAVQLGVPAIEINFSGAL
ncbi:hypothetical protein [Pseudoalteromonas sp. S16_S37]|uniref:hypothetical protein n=1 Tax=Pseudoalteromonas sp. S16_S37 TaxID=2720228 RepID=UPI0016810CE6|nr:hypothetical protein [Pseudoalteromonas sp. S16_S37]MBD1582781.1 hypothetical protein [Pseudoalteromonas sp. S16_S37]